MVSVIVVKCMLFFFGFLCGFYVLVGCMGVEKIFVKVNVGVMLVLFCLFSNGMD